MFQQRLGLDVIKVYLTNDSLDRWIPFYFLKLHFFNFILQRLQRHKKLELKEDCSKLQNTAENREKLAQNKREFS
jgi:hypothetical protein